MKLLCDVCQNAVASIICCADEAALCSSCDASVHAANKLASKHHRIPLLSEASEPALCDICQERPSFFFCVEDRALLCRECDVSVHSSNSLAAKHRRFLLTGIKVGMNPAGSKSCETSSAVSMEQHVSANSPVENSDLALKRPAGPQTILSPATGNCSKHDGGFGSLTREVNKVPLSSLRATKSTADPIKAKMLGSYTMTKDGTLRLASKTSDTNQRKAAAPADTGLNTTTISIQRISAGQQVPFVAPVLSSIRACLLQEGEASTNNNNVKDSSYSDKKNSNINEYSNGSARVDLDVSLPTGNDSESDYLNLGIPGWRLDELLTDLAGVGNGGRALSPPKENNVRGFNGIQEEQTWYAELDFLAEHELSPSQDDDGVALVPEMPSPPTSSGLVTSRGKPPCVQPWAFDYLFTGPDHGPHEFSVVPDIGGRKSSPVSPVSPARESVSKKRKFWHHD